MNLWSALRRPKAAAGCRAAMRELQSYLDGKLDEATAARVMAHLEDCRRCGLEAEVYTEIKEGLARGDRGVSHDAIARLQEFAGRLPDHDEHDQKPR